MLSAIKRWLNRPRLCPEGKKRRRNWRPLSSARYQQCAAVVMHTLSCPQCAAYYKTKTISQIIEDAARELKHFDGLNFTRLD